MLNEVLLEICPTEVEQKDTLSKVKNFLAKINKQLKLNSISAKAVLGGSYAKGTWLTGDYDVDIFVKFAKKHAEEDLSNLLNKALKLFKPTRIHGSRDYFWVQDSVKYEIVPVLDIKKDSDARNVTDFSSLHVNWVNINGEKFKDDIRLMKRFCKAAKCYGAESYIRGFSGHVVDILTIHYKGFLKTLKAATSWKPKVIIDHNKVFKGKALFMLNKSKTEGPLVVVDPVQDQRNAAAALTEENLNAFKKAAKAFLKSPSKKYFQDSVVDFKKLAKKGHLIKVEVKTLNAKEDVAGAKFVRAFEHARSALKDFEVKDSGWIWDRTSKGKWWFVLKNESLGADFEHKGPPLKMKQAVLAFKKAHKSTFTRKGAIFARVKRTYTNPKSLLGDLIKREFIKSRVLSAKL